MKRFSKVSFDDIKTIQVDSGVLLKEFDVENPVFLPENVICATSGGINPVCAPEYYDFGEDVDNAKSAKETKRIRGWNVSISFTTFTTSLDLIRFALGTADVSGKMLNIRQKLQYAKDFKDIWWVGKRADDKLIAIRLIRSLSDSGFSLQTTKKGKGQISVTLKGHSSFAEKDKIPMEVYVFAESDIPVTPDAPATALYLYGAPSTTGNIGLRSGDSVSYYDGAVLPKMPDFPTGYDFAAMAIQKIDNTDWYVARLFLFTERPVYGQAKKNAIFTVDCLKASGSVMEYVLYNTLELNSMMSFKVSAANVWEYYRTRENTETKYVFEDAVWTNTDILCSGHSTKADGTVYLAKSDPVPVTGIVDYIGDIPIYEVIK